VLIIYRENIGIKLKQISVAANKVILISFYTVCTKNFSKILISLKGMLLHVSIVKVISVTNSPYYQRTKRDKSVLDLDSSINTSSIFIVYSISMQDAHAMSLTCLLLLHSISEAI